MQTKSTERKPQFLLLLLFFFSLAPRAAAQNVTYKPYIQPGDNGPFGAKDQMVIAWQTDEASPNPSAFTVQFGKTRLLRPNRHASGACCGQLLVCDPSLPVPPTASGPHSNYAAVLKGLDYDTTYFYRVNGPGMPNSRLRCQFPHPHTR